jgi:glycosyltransferase involved in cell wall biosynthesis
MLTNPAPIAVVVSQHPAINHAVILREIRELRKQLELRTASIRGPDRPLEQLSAEERDEANRTYFVKTQGFAGALTAAMATLFTRPASFVAGLSYAVRLSRFSPRQMFKNTGYFAEALIIGQWMRRENLRHLHSHYSSTVGLLVKQVFPISLSISFHGPDEFSDPKGFWLKQKIEASDFVRAISSYARSQLMLCCGPEHWDKIEVAYMAVDPDVFSPRPFRDAPAPVAIICVGRLAPVKAQRVLLAAIATLVRDKRSVLLHVVGGGPDRQSLEQYADSLGIRQSIIFHGFTPQEKLDELYRSADIFALPSFAEGLPGVLMEAMAMEIPCVATGITGVPELIRDGVDGLLVPPADADALASAIASLMDDAVLRRRIAKAGRQRVLDKFSLQTNTRHLAGIFEHRVRGSG